MGELAGKFDANKLLSQMSDGLMKMMEKTNLSGLASKELSKITQKGASDMLKALIDGVKSIFEAVVKIVDSVRRIFELIAGNMVMCILLMIALLILVLVTIAYVIVQMIVICSKL